MRICPGIKTPSSTVRPPRGCALPPRPRSMATQSSPPGAGPSGRRIYLSDSGVRLEPAERRKGRDRRSLLGGGRLEGSAGLAGIRIEAQAEELGRESPEVDSATHDGIGQIVVALVGVVALRPGCLQSDRGLPRAGSAPPRARRRPIRTPRARPRRFAGWWPSRFRSRATPIGLRGRPATRPRDGRCRPTRRSGPGRPVQPPRPRSLPRRPRLGPGRPRTDGRRGLRSAEGQRFTDGLHAGREEHPETAKVGSKVHPEWRPSSARAALGHSCAMPPGTAPPSKTLRESAASTASCPSPIALS